MMRSQKKYNRQGIGAMPIVFAIIPLALLGGFFIFSEIRNPQTAEIKPIIVDRHSAQDSSSLDSDGDGLKDWEEQIYGTNPHNPDTDGDGTDDGDEIALSRDPLKPNTSKDPNHPNDYLTEKTVPVPPASSDTPDIDQPAITRKLAEVFGRDYLANLVQNPDQQPDLNGIANKMAQVAIDASASHTPPITIKDIITPSASADDMKKYLRQFDQILLAALAPITDKKSLTDIVANAVTDHASDAAVNELTVRINAYNQFLQNIKNLPIPEDFISLHLDYLNTAVREREAIEKIKAAKNDPALVIVGIRELSQTNTRFNDLQQQFIKLQRSKGIISNKK